MHDLDSDCADWRTTIQESWLLPRHRSSCRRFARVFATRYALNMVLSLAPEVRCRGLVAASTGNHGLGMAEALRLAGGHGTVVVSAGAAAYKRQRLADAGLHVITIDGDAIDAEHHARAMAERDALVYVSPYNDLDVIAGQGTIGIEIAEQLPDVELVFVPVGGGGLIAGVAAALKSLHPTVRVIGCWAERASAMYDAIRVGAATQYPDLPTLSDATAGGIERDSVTLPLCMHLIDDRVVVPEREIFDAMRDVLYQDALVIEGAAGAAVAGCRRYLREHQEDAYRRSLVVLCGSQVGCDLLGHVVRDELPPAVSAQRQC